ncbi:MAG: helix-turn-helix transcriptional regulator [Lentisphaeria bacterium]|nr:helix-turn-helix transcriptional regulator [Lentisphaeria bacterium]
MDLSDTFAILEEKLDCRLVYHDVRYRFFHTHTVKCQRKYLNLHFRNQDLCPESEVASCVKHCVVKLRNELLLYRPAVRVWRCRKGYVEIVAPVFRHDMLVGVLFAGIWQRPLPKDTLRKIIKLLPVIAEGLTAQMEAAVNAMADKKNFRSEVLAYLEKHYAEKITLHKLAHHLALSPSRICHLISEHFGKPLTKVLLELRLEKACTLLVENDLPIAETARLCGFNSVNYFGAAFRKKFNVSPKKYSLQTNKNRRRTL